MSKLKMVVGFMFNAEATSVLLIQKQKPAWQKNKLNGLGGKVEVGESRLDAMIREFTEEAGITFYDWDPVISLHGEDWEVQVFAAKTDLIFQFRQMEKEKLHHVMLKDLHIYNRVSNLNWLIPLCLDNNDGKGRIDYDITN